MSKESDELWKKIIKRAEGKCEYCKKNLFNSAENYLLAQWDAIIPESLGGTHDYENSALSCYACNVLLKTDWDPRTLTEYLDKRRPYRRGSDIC